jgi:hypothetical protein
VDGVRTDGDWGELGHKVVACSGLLENLLMKGHLMDPLVPHGGTLDMWSGALLPLESLDDSIRTWTTALDNNWNAYGL